MVRRKPGTLLPLEFDLLGAAIQLSRRGADDCYGYSLAATLAAGSDARRLIAHGTLYKALGRLTDAGLLDSWWEDATIAESEGRPRRRLYRVTGAGERAHEAAQVGAATGPARSGKTAARSTGPGPAPA